MMHEHDLDLIASHVSGLEDASALIESCPICREEFELHQAVRSELKSLEKPLLSEIERQRIARAVRTSVATPTPARFNRIAWGAVAASFVVLAGFAAIFTHGSDDGLTAPSFESAAADPYASESQEDSSTGGLGVPYEGDPEELPGGNSAGVESLDRVSQNPIPEFDSVEEFVWEINEEKADGDLYSSSERLGDTRCDSQMSGLILFRLVGRVGEIELIGYLIETSTGREIAVLIADSCERYDFGKDD